MEISKIIAILITGIMMGTIIANADDWTDVIGGYILAAFLMVLGFFLFK